MSGLAAQPAAVINSVDANSFVASVNRFKILPPLPTRISVPKKTNQRHIILCLIAGPRWGGEHLPGMGNRKGHACRVLIRGRISILIVTGPCTFAPAQAILGTMLRC